MCFIGSILLFVMIGCFILMGEMLVEGGLRLGIRSSGLD